MSDKLPPAPRCFAGTSLTAEASARRAAWAADTLRRLRAQGLQGDERLLILLGALGHEVAVVAQGEEAAALAYLEHWLGILVATQAAMMRQALEAVQPAGSA